LASLLEERLALVDQLHALAQRQAAFIADADAESLAALIASREEVVRQIRAGESVPADAVAAAVAARRVEAENPDLRRRIDAVIRTLDDRIADITRLDDAATPVLERARAELRRELATADRGRQAYGAYAGAAAGRTV